MLCHKKEETNSMKNIFKTLDTKWCKWILSLWLLSASCLTPLYTVPFLAARSNMSDPNETQIIESHLEKTLYDCFEELYHSSYSFSWIKILFFVGFAVSQITIGFLGDYFGKWLIFKRLIKVLIISGILVSITGGYIWSFSFLWFVISYCSTSTYLLIISTVLEDVDSRSQDDQLYIRRSFVAVLFQTTWYASRLFVLLTVYLCNEWTTVLAIIMSFIAIMFFTLKDNVWNSDIVKNYNKQVKTGSFEGLIEDCKSSYINIFVLSLTWITLGYNYYGTMNTWRNFSLHGKIFIHSLLAACLSLFGELMALMICLCIRRKILPTLVLQILTAGCYISLIYLFDPKENGKDELNSMYTVFIIHITSFFNSCVFALIWCITPETFPKSYRTSLNGICSFAARVGAIMGISFGEFDVLHRYQPIMILAAALSILSAVLLPILPEMTKRKMPDTFDDIDVKEVKKDVPE